MNEITFSLDAERRVRTATFNGVITVVAMFDPFNDQQVQSRLAIVAPRDDLFGMARMYELPRAEAPEEPRVCRTMADALAFLAGEAD